MPSAKSGKACTLIAPAPPDAAQDADVADPGAVDEVRAAQQQSGTGKYGSTPVTPFKPAAPAGGAGGPAAGGDAAAAAGSGDDAASSPPPTSFVGFTLTDAAGDPVAGEPYKVVLPDGSVADGTTGADGSVHLDGIPPGSCRISFPNLDAAAVSAA